ncbi:Radical SAM domain protein [Chloroherpeton thalassium ATCC 35110]|uniref:Radical SAM domain protein n=1 Tax=Chloroherpeton thalassium (strain ATCC 35110 / GB-78) TaxID=517418 RepID=B3QX34_CHLT3|nr:radical SAM protein [Chloroherpeton thalassium]ACF14844.1 Radical SAM domain protein [Chloroherpeton thalassium ATCC 35110]
MPLLCNYYLTYRCNAECKFCDIWKKPSIYASLPDIQQNLTDLKRLGVQFVDFTGGEPLLHKDLPEILSFAKQLGFFTSITTNTLLYPKQAAKLTGKVDLLHFSLDSIVPEKHDEIRGVSCFSKLLESIAVAKSLGEQPDILFTVQESNYKELPEVYETICRPNKLALIINPIFEYGEFFSAESTDAMFRYMLKFARRHHGTYLNSAFIKLRRDGGNNISAPVCKAVSEVIVISPYNEMILPCYHAAQKQIPIDGKLYELRHSDLVKKEIARQGRYDFCAGCTVNCYFEPSFARSMNRYTMVSIPAKIRYGSYKLFRQKLFLKVVKTKVMSFRSTHYTFSKSSK